MGSSLLLIVATLHGVRAWGSLGHATVAYIAQNYVTDDVATWYESTPDLILQTLFREADTQDRAQGVLDDTSDSYLANIASWADSYRETTAGAWSASLHFIDAEDDPPTACNVDFDRDCGDTGCSVSAITNYTQRVGDGRLSATNVNQALMFLVHFVGDITQPLHDEAYEVGGNDIDVTYQGEQPHKFHELLKGGLQTDVMLTWNN